MDKEKKDETILQDDEDGARGHVNSDNTGEELSKDSEINGNSKMKVVKTQAAVGGVLSEIEKKLELFQELQNSSCQELSWRNPNRLNERQRKPESKFDFQKKVTTQRFSRTNWRKDSFYGNRQELGELYGERSYSMDYGGCSTKESCKIPNEEGDSHCEKFDYSHLLLNENKFYGRNPLEGFFTLLCDNENADHNGLTESDRIFDLLNQLHQEKPNLLTRKPVPLPVFKGKLYNICCYTKDYTDKLHVIEVSQIIREKVLNYNFPLYYRKMEENKFKTLYMYTLDGDLYKLLEKKESNWFSYKKVKI